MDGRRRQDWLLCRLDRRHHLSVRLPSHRHFPYRIRDHYVDSRGTELRKEIHDTAYEIKAVCDGMTKSVCAEFRSSGAARTAWRMGRASAMESGYSIESTSGRVILDSLAEREDAREGAVVMQPGRCHAKSATGGELDGKCGQRGWSGNRPSHLFSDICQ